MAVLADLLTVLRSVTAVVLAASLGLGRIDIASALLALAWTSDFLDGRLARRAAESTRLHAVDLPVDTLVGAGALVGLQLGGYIPLWLSAGTLVVFGLGYVATGNPTLSLLLQAVGYGACIITAWATSAPLRWLPLVCIAVLVIVGRERLFGTVLPMFFSGFRHPTAHEHRRNA